MSGLQFRVAAAAALVLLGLLGWLGLSPGWAVAMLQEHARNQLGRSFEAQGGARLAFAPELSIRLERPSLAGPQGQDGPFMTAKALRLPVSLWQLVTRSPDLSAMKLEDPEFAFLVDERGQANWEFAAVKTPSALRIAVEHGRLRYFDARNGQSLDVSNANAIAQVNADGAISLNGTTEIGGWLARIAADLKSLARVHGDGSPLDLSVGTAEAAATFSGRLSTAKILSLAGPVTLASPDFRAAARWGGIPAEDAPSYLTLSVSGALDSAGRAFAIRQAEVALDQLQASGELVIDLRGAVPKLQAALSTARLRLDPFLPDSGAEPGDWGTAPLGFEVLKSFDAEVTVETPAFAYAGLAAFPARAVLTLAKGRLQAAIATNAFGDARLETVADAGVTPPAFSLSLEAGDAEALLGGLGGIAWLRGPSTVAIEISGSGRNQQEIIGTLKGKAMVSASNGSLVGPDLEDLFGAVSQRIIEGWGTSGKTDFTSLSASFTLADGIATTRDIKLQSPSFAVTADGEADMLRRALDLKAEPRLAAGDKGSAAHLPVPVIVKGPWGTPRLYPDIKDILLNPAAAFGQLKTMGLPAGN